jgi:hypothetical protein
VVKRRAWLFALAAPSAALAACDTLIGLSEPTVSDQDAGADAWTPDALGTDVQAVDVPPERAEAGDVVDAPASDRDSEPDATAWPPACAPDGACSSTSLCIPPYGLCEPFCSPVAPCPATAYCVTPDDSGSAFGGCVAGDYGCLGSVKYPPQSGPTVDVSVTLLDALGGLAAQVPGGILVSACDAKDLPCANPLATATTDDAETVTLHLPNAGDGFHGYLDLTGSSFTEQLVYWSHPITSGNLAILVGNSLVYQYAFPSATTTRGRLWIIAEGCVGTPAFGASFALSNTDPQTVLEVYGGGTTIVPDADAFPPTQWAIGTSLVAYGFADNAPTGPMTVTTTYAGKRVGTMQVDLRAGAVVEAVLTPTP